MKGTEIVKYLEGWAPAEVAWEKDNVGLQVGSLKKNVSNILLALDLNLDVIKEAEKRGCNFIITHHPLLFSPLTKISVDGDLISQLVVELIKNDITLYSAHTNLDFTRNGVSFKLAERLKLENVDFLKRFDSNQYKLSVFVPQESVNDVADAIFSNGGGVIGNYQMCSFRGKGEGTFKGLEKSNPSLGKKGEFEKVNEIKLEVLINKWDIKKIVAAMIKTHPYEEPAYDIYPLANQNVNYGIGAIGSLKKEMTVSDFLDYVSENVHVKNFRYTKGDSDKVNKVAVCGGSGSQFLNEALSHGADAYITADIKYHTFQDAVNNILLIDAGHYETEIISLQEVKKRLESFLKKNKSKIKILHYSKTTNPIIYYR